MITPVQQTRATSLSQIGIDPSNQNRPPQTAPPPQQPPSADPPPPITDDPVTFTPSPTEGGLVPPIVLATVRQRFQARTGAAAEHNAMVASPVFLRARDTALLAFQEDLTNPTLKGVDAVHDVAQANGYRLQGAARVLDIMSKLGWTAPAQPAPEDTDNLPAGRQQRR